MGREIEVVLVEPLDALAQHIAGREEGRAENTLFRVEALGESPVNIR
jgi:hypothetical protein